MKSPLIRLAAVILLTAISGLVYGQDESEDQNNAGAPKQEAATQQQGLKAYSKFDFVPGDRIIFYDDFSQDNIGDFPALWNTNASGEIVTIENIPGKWFKMQLGGYFIPELKDKFPDNFTIEYDYIYSYTNINEASDFDIALISTIEGERMDGLVPGNGGAIFRVNPQMVDIFDWKDGQYGEINKSSDNNYFETMNNKVVRVSIAVQKERVRVYLDQTKVFDVPKLLYAGMPMDRIRFYSGSEVVDHFSYISNFRVAVGSPDVRSKLMTEGKLVTRGILFDSGSDRIRPESYGTMKMIADVLKGNPSVRVKIVGHTDSDGDEKSNLDLSKRRAASVKNSMTSEFGIDAARMEVDGKGESEPVSPNTTSEGKANNRRVEFIKL